MIPTAQNARESAVPQQIRPPRLVVLDGLRILAALTVMFHHYVGFGGSPTAAHNAWGRPIRQVFPTAAWLGAYMWTGVCLFFLISGFVICMSSWGKGLGAFFTSRVTRLYPTYWFAILATTVVLTTWPMVTQPLDFFSIVTNLTMFQTGVGVLNLDAVYWTLWFELRFYLLFALVVWKGVTYNRVVAFCLIWTVAGMVSPTTKEPLLSLVAMPGVSSFFIAGLAYYLMYRFRPNLLLWGIVAVNLIISIDYANEHQRESNPWLGYTYPVWPDAVLVVLCYAVMAMVALGLLSRIQWKWLTWAGALTYPFYLVHENIGWTMIRLLHQRIAPWPLVGLTAVTMLAFAWLVHRLVERPLARLLKRGVTRALDEYREHTPADGAVPAPETVPQQETVSQQETVGAARR
ncbi:acyltransferase family protein [Streptacidiphilus carbonis]|uniref:acyltransferase family protein n=1 Tax=Streptacidiphilus carbonis TaxID=105422 RepID=UPI00126A467D|nr:acyltransferase [Streptacidiphilus carbonis]